MKILSRASAKKEDRELNGFKFYTFIGRFSNDIVAVKGLSTMERGKQMDG